MFQIPIRGPALGEYMAVETVRRLIERHGAMCVEVVEGGSTNSRSSTTRDISNTNPRSSTTRDVSSTNARSSTRRKYGGINSVDSDAGRWSDVYRGFSGDAKQ
jgi:hypothetical protein